MKLSAWLVVPRLRAYVLPLSLVCALREPSRPMQQSACKITVSKWAWRVLLVLSLAYAGTANADRTIDEDYETQRAASDHVGTLGPDLFGDHTDFNSGSTEFLVTDVSLPGNSDLQVALQRKFAADDDGVHWLGWSRFEVPYLSGIFKANAAGWSDPDASSSGQRCSMVGDPPEVTSSHGGSFSSDEYWHGNHLYLPGAGSQLMQSVGIQNPNYPTDGATYKWMTRGHWYFSCLPATKNGVAGEGFLALAPDGKRYYFDWIVRGNIVAAISKYAFDGKKTVLQRSEYRILLTRVEDRFGNWVNYTYSGKDLTNITANDGRQLTLTYQAPDGLLQSVTDGTRVWNYDYTSGINLTLPDSTVWSAVTSGVGITRWAAKCDSVPIPPRYTGGLTLTIKHPSGAVGQFNFLPIRRGLSYVPVYPVQECAPTVSDNIALIAKTISGAGVVPQSWNFVYGPPNACRIAAIGPPLPDGCAPDAPTTRFAEVTGPNNTFTRYTFGNKYHDNDGVLLKLETGSSASIILRAQLFTWDINSVNPTYPSPTSSYFNMAGDEYLAVVVRPQTGSTTIQDGVTFSSQIDTCGSAYCFDQFARPLSVTKSSSLGYTKTDTTEYHDNQSKWVLGQVKRTTTNGIETTRADYWPVTSLTLRTWSFGKAQQYFEYNPDGTLQRVTDGNNNAVTLSNWKRGIPQLIQHPATPDQPAGSSESAVVNNHGWVDAVIDQNGYRTCYTYDLMGRLASITPPSEATPSMCDTLETNWKKTISKFTNVATPAAYGLPAGHWRQTVNTGNARSITFFDAMWRPVVKETYDATNSTTTAATLAQTITRYDASGRPSFVSYPQRTLVPAVIDTWANPAVTPNALGIRTEYDALDRVTATRQDSELGVLSTTTEYLPGFKTKTKSPRGQSTGAETVTSYMAYDQPTMDWPISIVHPEGALTDIARDVFGKPLYVWRHSAGDWGMRHYYVYDGFQRLCKRTDVETGTNAFGYDNAGNLTWSASGLSWSPAGPCEHTAASVAARRVDRAYDARNRLMSLTFLADGNGNQTWHYTPANLPAQVSTWNIPATGALAKETRNLYGYNKRRLLTTETLDVPDWYTYELGYGYDKNGSLASQTYPSNHTVNYAPNALGQATQAVSPDATAPYASGVSYYPNGAIEQFTYGNNIVHVMLQNTRQLPSWVAFNNYVGRYQYGYDANGNATNLIDQTLNQNGRATRTMAYDDLDRLTGATSPMFGTNPAAAYTYNTLDNLTRAKVAGRDTYYCYNANNRLDFVRTGPTCTGTASPTIDTLGYDLQGNLAYKDNIKFDFDDGNRLREVYTGATPGLAPVERYRYDAHGRRVIASRVSGLADTLGVIFSDYANNGQLLHQENLRPAVNKAIDYIYLAGSLIVQREVSLANGAVGVKYQHTDALGSPVALTNSAGTVLERMEYEPYGQRIGGTPKDGPGYTGHVLDLATGMNYMQQRYYDPGIGRFLSVDPVTANSGTGANFNRYWYANNNPTVSSTPMGGNRESSTSKINEMRLSHHREARKIGWVLPLALRSRLFLRHRLWSKLVWLCSPILVQWLLQPTLQLRLLV